MRTAEHYNALLRTRQKVLSDVPWSIMQPMQQSTSIHLAIKLFVLWVAWMVGTASAVSIPSVAAQTSSLPPPHLGYGVHVGPHNSSDPALVDQLRMDWVKLYDISQISDYRDKRILFRVDLAWPSDWNNFRNSLRQWAVDLSAQGVDAIEVHNEPNLAMEWPHGPNAWEYTQMLRVAYTQIKQVNPNIIVVSGGLAPTLTTNDRGAINDLDYAAEMLDNGAAQWFDAFGYHPYGYNEAPEAEPTYNRPVFRRTELIRDLFEERGIYDKQIWLTEFGWLRDPAEDGVQCSDSDPDFAGFAWLRVSAETQADYMVRAFQWADRNWPWVGPMFVWNLNWALYPEHINAMCNHMRWFSLLRQDGTRLPIFERLASMPHRYSDYQPQMTLYAENMTVETSGLCPGAVMVGEFDVLNTGFPGRFTATATGVSPPGGPAVEVLPSTVESGERVQVFADVEGLPPGLHIIYVNVTTTIGGDPIAQTMQGYIVINNALGACE
jgi:hypothetical protein